MCLVETWTCMCRALQSQDGVTSPSQAELPRLVSLKDGCPSSGVWTSHVNRGRHLPELTSATDDDIPSPGQTKWKIGFAERGFHHYPDALWCLDTTYHRSAQAPTGYHQPMWQAAGKAASIQFMPWAASSYTRSPLLGFLWQSLLFLKGYCNKENKRALFLKSNIACDYQGFQITGDFKCVISKAYHFPHFWNNSANGSVPKVTGSGEGNPHESCQADHSGDGSCAYYWVQIKVDSISG